MQWTDDSGGAYGEDPYGGVGYGYAYGYEHSGSAASGTAALSWDPVQHAQPMYPTGSARVAGTGPHAAGPYPYAAGPGPATTAWDAAHGDVLTVPPSALDTPSSPVPGPDTPKSESVRPVFVDSSGRRQRRVLRAARLLVIPAGGYVALLISAVLGGPSLDAPFVPQLDSTHPTTPHVSAPDASPGTGHSAGSTSPAAVHKNSRSTAARKTSGPADRPTAAATSAATPVPAAAPSGIASPTVTATPHHTSRGRAVGSSHNPVK